jgi:hypothetical protein
MIDFIEKIEKKSFLKLLLNKPLRLCVLRASAFLPSRTHVRAIFFLAGTTMNSLCLFFHSLREDGEDREEKSHYI